MEKQIKAHNSKQPDNFLNVKIDEEILRELLKEYLELPEENRFVAIQPFLLHKKHKVQKIGLYLIKSSLYREEDLIRVLEIALEQADASWIRTWLEHILPNLGIPKTLSVLRKNLLNYSPGVDSALYWLPWYIDSNDVENVSAFKELMKEADELGIIRKPQIVPIYKK